MNVISYHINRQATGWLKRESELAQQAADSNTAPESNRDVSSDKKKRQSWFGLKGGARSAPFKIVPQMDKAEQTSIHRTTYLTVKQRRFLKL